ncbi:Ankyrin repeat-containing protein [Melia azedarach]|uniref:Ankyrin repeat-containing protein n=1 Tax=Melia azedarach TaxID=155640 RepID=A0ACC1WTN4_MELAZ|nr:Ankyrin repeat-containing protein [Melia azedarach]
MAIGRGAKRIYDEYEDDIGVEISEIHKSTALHIAAAVKHVDFVKELVKIMDENDLRKKNKFDNTAFFLAAASGMVEAAKEIMKNDTAIAMVPDICGRLPIHMAALSGHKDMFALGAKSSFYVWMMMRVFWFPVVPLQLLRSHPDLATARAKNNETALHVLAQKHMKFSNLANPNQLGIFKRAFNFGFKVEETEKKELALKLVECIWKKVVSLSSSELSKLVVEPRNLIFDAAEKGNVELLIILINGYPDLIWRVYDIENFYSIFHIAVKNRHEDIFKLIYKIGSNKEMLLSFVDQNGNNILHLAAMLGPLDQLNFISGEALQFQRELLWFQKVENVAPKQFSEAVNKDGLTPRALFLQQHKELREKGEKWMKETANANVVVAILIVTVAFTATLTVPGGNNQVSGFPIFIQKSTFKIFAISDAMSLVFSLTSVATFLHMFTSRYAEEDMLWRLPRKFYIGMLLLLISLVALVVVFSTIFFIFFSNSELWIAILFVVVAPTPLCIFLLRNIHQLFSGVLYMIYNLQSAFQQESNKLLFRELEESDQHQQGKTRIRQLKLYRAALASDWEVVKRIYNENKDDIGVAISGIGLTALHIAAAKRHADFVKELVKIMDENDLKKVDVFGQTALAFAAARGQVELAQEIMKNDKAIAMIPDKNGLLPIHSAAVSGHKDVVEYLYQETKYSFLFLAVGDVYDVALQLLEDYPDVAIACVGDYGTPLHAIARKDLPFSKLDSQNVRGIPSRCLSLVERGNIEFLCILIREYPDIILLHLSKENDYNIFHIAVMNRQEHVFKLIDELFYVYINQIDEEGNNILHLAGMLAPSHRLNIAAGAALQMRRELLWFKEVEKFVLLMHINAKNKKGLTPKALFTEQHKDLREKGEKWMKDTTTSCMLLATLIATIVFAATFTVPGGIKEDTGSLLHIHKVSLKIFFISNAIALVSSSASIVNFLSILTSPYAEEEFLWSLPRKLRIGLVTFFISIAAMMAHLLHFLRRHKVMDTYSCYHICFNTSHHVYFATFQTLFYCSVFALCLPAKQNSCFPKKEETSDQQRRMAKICNEHLRIPCTCSTNV